MTNAAGDTLRAPFPYFGGKSRIAPLVWSRLGNVPNYVEPFLGSAAVLLARPHEPHIETINDKDGFVSNFWRALRADPEQTAHWADNPVFENDLHARHSWLVGQAEGLQAKLEGDPDYYDAKIAGWWVWGMACWIGGGFCSGEGPWHSVDGELVNTNGNTGLGVNRRRVLLSGAGQGVNSQDRAGQLQEYFAALADRFARVRVCCGDWTRVCGPTPTFLCGLTGVFLDPPYSHAERDSGLYRQELSCADAVREWAVEMGERSDMRIALCGYDGEHAMPSDWEEVAWKATGGYGARGNGRGKDNAHRERVWFSPACLKPVADGQQPLLFPVESETFSKING